MMSDEISRCEGLAQKLTLVTYSTEVQLSNIGLLVINGPVGHLANMSQQEIIHAMDFDSLGRFGFVTRAGTLAVALRLGAFIHMALQSRYHFLRARLMQA